MEALHTAMNQFYDGPETGQVMHKYPTNKKDDDDKSAHLQVDSPDDKN